MYTSISLVVGPQRCHPRILIDAGGCRPKTQTRKSSIDVAYVAHGFSPRQKKIPICIESSNLSYFLGTRANRRVVYVLHYLPSGVDLLPPHL